MKVLIITLYSGENEFEQCINSVNKQVCSFCFEHVFIKNKTNQEAHNELYNMIMSESDKYDYFIKLDADMVLSTNDSLYKFINLAIDSEADIFSIPVDDFMTGKMIWSLNIYKSGVKWQLGTESIFTDQQMLLGVFSSKKMLLSKKDSLVSHASNPSNFQAFTFGVHRASKIIQANTTDYKIGHAYGQYQVIKDVLEVYNDRKSYRHGLALIGAYKMLQSELSRSDMIKKDFYKKDFENIAFSEDVSKSIAFLQMPGYYIFLKAVGYRKVFSGIPSYICNKYKRKFNK